MGFADYRELGTFFLSLNVVSAYYKPLAENDNSKQQIYLGGSFSVLQQLPFGEIVEFPENRVPNYKAAVELYWVDDNRRTARAPGAQLILYPKYPEVRLSGFMLGCETAPTGHMNPVPEGERKNNNGKDGRVLVFGVTADRKIYTYLALKDSVLAGQILSELFEPATEKKVLNVLPLEGAPIADRDALLEKLREVIGRGWMPSVRMYADGSCRPYNAKNGGGYTLEAAFGIIPNGLAEPDFCGWELKAFSGSRLTLMTPEPDRGLYRERGAKEFALKYGHVTDGALAYFTGTHRVGIRCAASGLTLDIAGYNALKGTIEDVSGGIRLVDKDGNAVALWSFSGLLKHWCRKHAHACYVPYAASERDGVTGFTYKSPVHLGQGTQFPKFLEAMLAGYVVYDPAVKVTGNTEGNTRVKARSQFRIGFGRLSALYDSFGEVAVF